MSIFKGERKEVAMRSRVAVSAVVSVMLLVAGASAWAAVAPCPSNFKGYETAGETMDCKCTPAQMSGSVWGSGRYTTDSSICAAARHAGVVGSAGGDVKVYPLGGCQSYAGSTKNGITSSKWGPYQVSFGFEADVACGGGATASTGGGNKCPADMRAHQTRATSDPLECTCPAGEGAGSVWGSSLYTTDSSVCRAARHAGAVGARGGAVTIFVAGGCSSYDGTTKNGVTTSSWASFSHSFGFAFPLPACADGKKPAKQ
jgi:hypothetical protein